jgi:hypothetical protein
MNLRGLFLLFPPPLLELHLYPTMDMAMPTLTIATPNLCAVKAASIYEGIPIAHRDRQIRRDDGETAFISTLRDIRTVAGWSEREL